MRRIGLPITFALAVLSAYFLQPLVSGNKDAINTIVTVFSILAGFLIAVITFIGASSSKSWQTLQLSKRGIQAKLWRHKMLFYLYLMTLGFALAMFLVPTEFMLTMIWLERFFVGCAVFVFLCSFALPQSLMDLKLEQYEEALDEKIPPALKGSPNDN